MYENIDYKNNNEHPDPKSCANSRYSRMEIINRLSIKEIGVDEQNQKISQEPGLSGQNTWNL